MVSREQVVHKIAIQINYCVGNIWEGIHLRVNNMLCVFRNLINDETCLKVESGKILEKGTIVCGNIGEIMYDRIK